MFNTFLKAKFAGEIIAVIVAVMLITIFSLWLELRVTKSVLEKKETRLAQVEASNTSLIGAITSQNKAIETLQQLGEQMTLNAKKLVGAAQLKANDHYKRAGGIMAHQPKGDPCVEAENLLAEYVKGSRP